MVIQLNYFETKTPAEPRVSPKKISLEHLDPGKEKVQSLIVSIHNYYRAKVYPPAANMLELASALLP